MFNLVLQKSALIGLFAPVLILWMVLPLIACIGFVVRFYQHKAVRHSGLITMAAALPLAVPEPMVPSGMGLVFALLVLMLCPCASIYALMLKSDNRARYQEMVLQFIPIILWILMKDIPGPSSFS